MSELDSIQNNPNNDENSNSEHDEMSKTSNHDNSTHSSNDSDNSTINSEYTEVNLQEDRLYQVLSTFFENDDGDNLTTILSNINENIQVQNKILNNIAQIFSTMQLNFSGGDESDQESVATQEVENNHE